MSASKVLNAAADLLAKPGAWTQGEFARTAKGRPIGPRGRNAVCWCVTGAIKKFAATKKEEFQARGLVWDYLHYPLAEFNDAPGRTQAEVVAALRAAALQEVQPR